MQCQRQLITSMLFTAYRLHAVLMTAYSWHAVLLTAYRLHAVLLTAYSWHVVLMTAFESKSNVCSSIKSIKSTQSEQLTRTSQCLFEKFIYKHCTPFILLILSMGLCFQREVKEILDQRENGTN